MKRAICILVLFFCLAGCQVDHAAFMRNWRTNPWTGQWVDDQGRVHDATEPRDGAEG
jgi:hypothetical protein